jgi:hypothetical protein
MTSAVLLPMSFARGCDVHRFFLSSLAQLGIPGL